MVKQPLQRCRRAIDGHRQFLAHHRHREVNGLDPAQDIGNEVAALEARRVLPKGYLVVRCAVDVVEDRTRQPSPGQFAEVMEVVTIGQAHVRKASPAAGGGRWRPTGTSHLAALTTDGRLDTSALWPSARTSSTSVTGRVRAFVSPLGA